MGKPVSSFSEKVKQGLEEILEYKQGKRTLRTKLIDPLRGKPRPSGRGQERGRPAAF